LVSVAQTKTHECLSKGLPVEFQVRVDELSISLTILEAYLRASKIKPIINQPSIE
jgi:hypothetical protein